ncbi:MAG: VOC family protein [Candidatus Latescibacteria bacterium]|nr:VOC family protein [Candidatus Latescibacterota bacterium]
MSINNLHKIAIVTDDIEAGVKFYTEKLGLKVVERFPNEGDGDFVFLQAGNGIILELMPAKTMKAPVGFHHISFRVDNADQAVAELKGKGVKVKGDPAPAGDSGIRLAFFEGPNEMNLQLFERDR